MKHIYPDQVDEPKLTRLIQEFIHSQHYPESSPCNIPDLPPLYEKITIHTSAVTTFHAPSDLSGIGGMKCECNHAVGCWRKGLGCYNTLFINTPHDDVDDNASILGLEVACTHLFFSFTLDGVKYLCALVHWIYRTTDTLSDITGMHVVEPDCLPDGQPVTAVVHLNTVFRAAHLPPIFSDHPALSKHQHHEETLDLFLEFYVNRYIDCHVFEVVV